MHRTESIDYGIVLEGEITLIVDEGETTVRAGASPSSWSMGSLPMASDNF